MDANFKDWASRIGNQVRAQRRAHGIRQEDLSLLSGATVATVSHIERGTRDIKLSTLVSLANALHTDLPSLLGTKEETRRCPNCGTSRTSHSGDDQ